MVRSRRFLKANIENLLSLISGESSHQNLCPGPPSPSTLKKGYPRLQVLQPTMRVQLSLSTSSFGQSRMRRAMPSSSLTLVASTTWHGFSHESTRLQMSALILCWLE